MVVNRANVQSHMSHNPTRKSIVGPMDEGRERDKTRVSLDKTSRGGGLPTLPGLYLSTIQPSQ
jgi:hypothetical protein